MGVFQVLYLSMALEPFVGPWPLLSFLISYTDGRTPWKWYQPVARPLHRTTQTQNKRTQTSMPQAGFEPMISVYERAKTALDRAALRSVFQVLTASICTTEDGGTLVNT
jgi:hypothetical protein